MNGLERVIHAVVFTANGEIIRGKQHADCYKKGHDAGIKMSKSQKDQGFQTTHRFFASRLEAAKIAFEAEQVVIMRPILFSEDLWCEEHGGEYDYDEDFGYFKRGDQPRI